MQQSELQEPESRPKFKRANSQAFSSFVNTASLICGEEESREAGVRGREKGRGRDDNKSPKTFNRSSSHSSSSSWANQNDDLSSCWGIKNRNI